MDNHRTNFFTGFGRLILHAAFVFALISMFTLATPVSQLYMVGPIYAQRLKKLGIETISDLLYHVPFRYDDFSTIAKINTLQAGEQLTVVGTITKFENVFTRHGKKIQKAVLSDETGEIDIVWYNQHFLQNILKPQMRIAVCGQVKWFGHKFVIDAPEYEIIKSGKHLIHTGRLVPVYPETSGVSSKWLRSRIESLLYKFHPRIEEFLPPVILKDFDLMGEMQAIHKIHFPSSFQEEKSARRRLSFDELFILILAAKERRENWKKTTVNHRMKLSLYRKLIDQFIQSLPFTLTNAQCQATEEIFKDLSGEIPMNRLLEGDVGSGKTIVAAIAMYLTFLNGFQSVLMSPTEILANQHFETIFKLFKPFGIKVALITGSHRIEKSKKKIDIYIGTHALLFQELNLHKTGLAVIDEQQRFGVRQRAVLREKGHNPHVLVMTATPIPRTVALTLYADLELSILDEMPPGRCRVKTWVVPREKRASAYRWIQKLILGKGANATRQQAFIICPLIEESETLESVKAVKVEFNRLKNEIFPDLNLGILHGRLSSKEKNHTLKQFKEGKIDILVATPVVEVGIDIPRATIMMIEAAERFGLAQLHQLRGRVGRNTTQSYCLLFTESANETTINRLKILERIFNGPKLAQRDLELRGAGEIFGTKQHGEAGLKIADLSDLFYIEEAKKAVNLLTNIDPTLSPFPLLRRRLEKYTMKSIAPD